MKRLLQGAPVVSGPANVESYREAVANGVLLTTSHDGYLPRFGVVHRRVLMVAHDGIAARRRGTAVAGAGRPDQGQRDRLRAAISSASLGEGEPAQRRPRRDAGAAEPRRLDLRGAGRQGRARRQRVSGRQRRPPPHRPDRDPAGFAAGPLASAGVLSARRLRPRRRRRDATRAASRNCRCSEQRSLRPTARDADVPTSGLRRFHRSDKTVLRRRLGSCSLPGFRQPKPCYRRLSAGRIPTAA